MTSAAIAVTAVVALYSLWVRRDTWWSRWEIGITLAIALETCALVLLSPWTADQLGPTMHTVTRTWNTQQLVGHLCFVVAVAANIYHVLRRLAAFDRIPSLYQHHVVRPMQIGVAAMVTLFVVADADFHPHGFSTGDQNVWLDAYWVALCALLIYLSGYATRLLLVLRSDPRAKETVELYTASAGFALAGLLAQLSTTWIDADLSTLVWLCVCMAIIIFAYGSARSWRAKTAWFAGDRPSAVKTNPPQALS